ncbi:hypothetical protein DSECCO2_567290 [anaerobic digester metagenome]
MQIVEPEIVFDKKRGFDVEIFQQHACMSLSVGRQIQNQISFFVIFSHFKSRRAEKCEKNFILGIIAPVMLYKRPALLKFTER